MSNDVWSGLTSAKQSASGNTSFDWGIQHNNEPHRDDDTSTSSEREESQASPDKLLESANAVVEDDRPISLQVARPSTAPLPSKHSGSAFIVSHEGRPFTDFDAATIKKLRLERELGEQFDIVTVDGGFALNVHRKDAAGGPVLPPVADRYSDVQPAIGTGRDTNEGISSTEIEKGGKKSLHKSSRILVRPSFRSQLPNLVFGSFVTLLGAVPDKLLHLVLGEHGALEIAHKMDWNRLCHGVGLALYAFGGFMLLKAILSVFSCKYEITEHYVVARSISMTSGKLRYQSTKTLYQNILTTEVDQGLLALMLNYGTVVLETAGDIEPRLVNVARPASIQQLVEQRKASDAAKQRNR